MQEKVCKPEGREVTYADDMPPPPRLLWAGELASSPVGDSGMVASPGSWLTSEVMAAAIFEARRRIDSDRGRWKRRDERGLTFFRDHDMLLAR